MAAPDEVWYGQPGRLQQLAYDCWSDFPTYVAFVHQRKPALHHQVVIERLLYGAKMTLVLGPPGVGKTTWAVWYAEWTLGRDPNYRWLIASEVANGIATTNVSAIAGTIELNERYHFVFGRLKDPSGREPWSTQRINLRPLVTPATAPTMRTRATPPPPWPWLSPRGRDLRVTGKHPSAKAVGWRTGYAGARCDGIIADDLVSDRLSRSARMTQAVYDTLHQKLLARLDGDDPKQKVVIFGQHYAARDLYSKIRERGCVVWDNNPARQGLQVLEPEARAEAAA